MLLNVGSAIGLFIAYAASNQAKAEEITATSWQEEPKSNRMAADLLGMPVSSYQAYSPQDLADSRLSNGCKSILTNNLRCDPLVDGFRELRYRGALPNDNITNAVCNKDCGVALGFWYYASQEACGNETLYDAPATIVPGRIWQGWNESCITEPRTNLNCNDVIAKFPEVEWVEEMDNAQLCSFCWTRRHSVMRSPYSIYNSYYQHVLETINSRCGLNKPTSIPPPVIPVDEPKPAFCATAQFYITVQGDTCSSIAIAKNLSSSSLWYANQELIGTSCASINAGTRLCLPYSCSEQYRVQPGDTCMLIELRNNLYYGTLRRYNTWLNDDCSNLQSGVKNMGNVLCTTPAGAANFALTPPKIVSQPGSGPRNSG